MLHLTRRINEKVKIGDDITIVVLGIDRGQVKLGFDAPPEVPIHREEIYTKILLERAEANDE